MQGLKPSLSGLEERIHTTAPCGMQPKASPNEAPQGFRPVSTPQNGGVQTGHVMAKSKQGKGGARNRFVKVRLNPDEYGEVAVRADREGWTMCEYVRQQLLTVHTQLDVRAELAALRAQLAATPTAAPDTDSREALLLLRELAAARDLGILARVRAQLGRAV